MFLIEHLSHLQKGGAAGIGLAIVKYLAHSEQNVAHIALLDIDSNTANSALKSLEAEFPHLTFSFHLCDVASWEIQAQVFRDIYTKQGRIDIVCANAGIGETGSLFTTAGDEPVKPAVSLAAFYLSRNQPSPVTGIKGSIICTASNSGIYPLNLAPIYTTAKYGVVGLVRGLADRFQHEKIQINAIAPCIVETNIGARLRELPGIVFTPISTVTKAVGQLFSSPELNGKILEISEDRITMAEPPPFVDESTKSNLDILGDLAKKIWRGNFEKESDK
ncbi:hypothetical protein AnigIFM62618_002756 [Aspergillus niger]|nr:hypothetical protein AnigIFM62618_002756 [Aspergillus niger]